MDPKRSKQLRTLDVAFKRLLVKKMGRTSRPQLFCSWVIFRGVSCFRVFTVLTSRLLVSWFSGMRSAYGFLCLATVIAWVLLFLSPSFVVVPLLLGDSSFYRYLDFYWILRGFRGHFLIFDWPLHLWTQLSPLSSFEGCDSLPSSWLPFFNWLQSFRLDLPSSSSWLISFVWKHYVPISLFVSRENLRHFFRPRIDKSICVKKQQQL